MDNQENTAANLAAPLSAHEATKLLIAKRAKANQYAKVEPGTLYYRALGVIYAVPDTDVNRAAIEAIGSRVLPLKEGGVVGNGEVVENKDVDILKATVGSEKGSFHLTEHNAPCGFIASFANEDDARRYAEKRGWSVVRIKNSVVSNALAWKRGVAVNGEVKDRLVEFKKLIDSNINQGAVRDGYVRIVQAVQKAGLDRSPILVVAHGILSDYSLNDFYSKHKKDADAKLDSLIAKFAANSVCNVKFKVGDAVEIIGPKCATKGKVGQIYKIDPMNKAWPYKVHFGSGISDGEYAESELYKAYNSSVQNAKFKVGDRVRLKKYGNQIGTIIRLGHNINGKNNLVKFDDGSFADDIFKDGELELLANSSGAVATTNAVVNAALAWKNGQYDHLAGTDYYCQPLKLMDRIEMRDFKHAGVKGYIKSLDKQQCICDVILDDTTVLKNVPTKIVAKSH